MDSLKKQRIESSSITCVSKKVDRFSFDGGMTPKEGVKKSDRRSMGASLSAADQLLYLARSFLASEK